MDISIALRQKFDALLEAEKFDDVLALLSDIETQRSLTLRELVIKGRCIQLTSDLESWQLTDAVSAFEKALEIEPDYVPALIELGFFYYAIEDNASRALPLFEAAVRIVRAQLTEAAVGKSGCLEELEGEEAAATFLNALHRRALLEEELDEEKRHWLNSAQDT